MKNLTDKINALLKRDGVREYLLLKLKGCYNGQCFDKPYSIRDRDWRSGFKRKNHEIIDVIDATHVTRLESIVRLVPALVEALQNIESGYSAYDSPSTEAREALTQIEEQIERMK